MKKKRRNWLSRMNAIIKTDNPTMDELIRQGKA